MSDRISEILEVLNFVRNLFTPKMSDVDLIELRKEATISVSRNRNIGFSTVSNKYRRELKPNISNTGDFDGALQAWLRINDKRLQFALLKHSVNNNDKQAVRNFFDD